MLRYIIRRLAFLLLLMVGVTAVVFLLSHAVPSDPVVAGLRQLAA
jgi:peptide/nickel transport system permease protein